MLDKGQARLSVFGMCWAKVKDERTNSSRPVFREDSASEHDAHGTSYMLASTGE